MVGLLAATNAMGDASQPDVREEDAALSRAPHPFVKEQQPQARVAQRREDPGLEGATVAVKEEPSTSSAVALADAAQDLAEQVDLSIDGIIEVNRIVEKMLLVADVPVDPLVDYDNSRGGSISHRLRDLPEGFEGHFRVDSIHTTPSGESFNSLRLVLQKPDESNSLVRGAARYGPRIEAALTYSDDSQSLARVGIMLQNEMNFRASLEQGVNPDIGQYASGTNFVLDLTTGLPGSASTMGYRDGFVTTTAADPEYVLGPAQVTGDLKLNREAADGLLRKLIAKKAELATRRHQ
ncbi:MAG: hypothetical protein AAFU73_04895 [Planctomycetota bacterium]